MGLRRKRKKASHGKNAVAIIPDEDKSDLGGTERDKWEKLTPAERAKANYSFDGTATEKSNHPSNASRSFR